MKIIDSKFYKYLGSTTHREYAIVDVDKDDYPFMMNDRVIKLHHFINLEHQDELITVRECKYILKDGRSFEFNIDQGYENVNLDKVFDDFIGNPY